MPSTEEERELQDIAAECVCSACGHGLATPWRDGALRLWCHRCKGYHGHVKPDIAAEKLKRMKEAKPITGIENLW